MELKHIWWSCDEPVQGLLIVPYGIETEYQIVIILGQGLLILPFNLKLGN